MRNTILTAMFLMLVPGMASAQFYTITKETEVKPIQINRKEKAIDNKKDTVISKSIERTKYTTVSLSTDSTSLIQYAQKVDGWTSQKFKRVKPNSHLPDLTIPNLYTEIKRNGILYPKVVLAQAILETGWFTSPLCRDRHNLIHTLESIMSLSIGRKVSAPTIPRCSTSTNEKMGTICFG